MAKNLHYKSDLKIFNHTTGVISALGVLIIIKRSQNTQTQYSDFEILEIKIEI